MKLKKVFLISLFNYCCKRLYEVESVVGNRRVFRFRYKSARKERVEVHIEYKIGSGPRVYSREELILMYRELESELNRQKIFIKGGKINVKI